MQVDFQTDPSHYRHWRLEYHGDIARLIMDVDEGGGLFEGYELKLNSYDLGVDIELADAMERLRFEHPEVKVVILCSGKDRVFCAGANIRMLAGATHAHKVGFCKFTNETRNAIEDASAYSGLKTLCAVSGICAGGGYELALAADHIILIDDGSSPVSLPEAPLLAVLPGTGGLTRLTDKRKVRRDRIDFFCTAEEGIRGKRAVEWRLVDEIAPSSRFEEAVSTRARALADSCRRSPAGKGIKLGPIHREIDGNHLRFATVEIEFDRDRAMANLHLRGPARTPPPDIKAMKEQGDQFWPLLAARELDHAILHLRLNEPELGVLAFRISGDPEIAGAYDTLLTEWSKDWLVHEIRGLWTRVLKRIDLTSRSLVALIEPGSCYTGWLCEIAFACDRSFMALGTFADDPRPEASIRLSEANFGAHPMSNGLSRLETRLLGEPETVEKLRARPNARFNGEEANEAGLVTAIFDDVDWEDEIRVFLEERASFSPDALTGLEANLRFAGPETMETKIFGRLTAWQNWIFQRPNAVGEEGALKRYGTGRRAKFNAERV